MNVDAAMASLITLVGTLGRPVFDTAGTLPLPYHVLSTGGQGRVEAPESDNPRESSFRLRVTSAAGTPQGARIIGTAARDLLCPSRSWSEPVTGVSVRWAGRDADDVDRSITIPGTNRNPAYVVDTFDVTTT